MSNSIPEEKILDDDAQHPDWAVDTDPIPSFFSRQYVKFIKFRQKSLYTNLTAKPSDPALTTIDSPIAWTNIVPGYVIGTLAYARFVIAQGIAQFPKLIPPLPKDAFWVVSQLPSWLTWVPQQIGYGLNWISARIPFLTKIVPYFPFIGGVLSAIESCMDFYQEKNKNFSAVLKLMTNIASAVLLTVAAGFMLWGSAVAMVTIVPYLLAAATIIISAVGLVRTFSHLYLAYQDPVHRKEHLINCGKQFLNTFVQAASVALLFIGVQIGNQFSQYFQFSNIAALIKGSALYSNISILTNLVLIAVVAPVIEPVAKIIHGTFNKMSQLGTIVVNYLSTKSSTINQLSNTLSNAYQKTATKLSRWFSSNKIPKTEVELSQEKDREKQKLTHDINLHIAQLQRQITTSEQISAGTSYIQKKLHEIRNPNERRDKKIELLKKVNQVLNDNSNMDTIRNKLSEIEKTSLLESNSFFSKPSEVYQSFFKLQGKTEELVQRSFKLTELTR